MTGRNAPCPCGSGKKFKLCCARSDQPVATRSTGVPAPSSGAATPKRGEKTLTIAMPTRGSLSVETHIALSANVGMPFGFTTIARKPVDVARNELTAQLTGCLTARDFVLWVDDDAWWQPGTVKQMLATMEEHAEIDLLAPLVAPRVPFCYPDAKALDGSPIPDGAKGLVPVAQVGFTFCITRVSALLRAGRKPFELTNVLGEDFSFCDRLRAAGGKIAVDSRISVAQIDVATGLAFLPGRRPLRVVGNSLVVDGEFQGLTDQEICERFESAVRPRSYGPRVGAPQWGRLPGAPTAPSPGG